MNENPNSVGEQLSFNYTNVHRPEFKSAIRGMQLITASLMLGALSLLFVVMFTLEPDSDSGPLGLGNPSVITLAGVAFGVLIAVSHFVVPGIIASAKLKQACANQFMEKDESSKQQVLIGIYRTHLIVGLALLEGAAFFNLIALMLGKNVLSWCAFCILFCFLLSSIPTRDKFSFWVQDKLREMSL